MKKISIFMILIVLLFNNCKKNDETNNPVNNTNTDKPNGNSLILNTKEFGNGTTNSEFYRLEPDAFDDNNLIFYALIDNEKTIGKISTTGNILWQSKINFNVREIKFLPNNLMLISGKTDDYGVVAVYKETDGSFVSDLTFNNYKSIINGTFKTSSGFVSQDLIAYFQTNSISYNASVFDEYPLVYCAFGACNQNNVFYPYFAFFSISSTGMLSKTLPNAFEKNELVLTQFPNIILNSYPDSRGGSNSQGGVGTLNFPDKCNWNKLLTLNEKNVFSYYQINNSLATLSFGLLKLDITWAVKIDIATCQSTIKKEFKVASNYLWSNEVKSTSSIYKSITREGFGGIVFFNSPNFLVCGQVETETNKDVKPNDGTFWQNGIFSIIDKDGKTVNNKTVSISTHSDYFRFVTDQSSTDGTAILSGMCAQYANNSGNYFGYGLITVIDNLGNIKATKYFGDENNQSMFNSHYTNANTLIAVGRTKRTTENSGSKAWFVVIDKTKLMNSK